MEIEGGAATGGPAATAGDASGRDAVRPVALPPEIDENAGGPTADNGTNEDIATSENAEAEAAAEAPTVVPTSPPVVVAPMSEEAGSPVDATAMAASTPSSKKMIMGRKRASLDNTAASDLRRDGDPRETPPLDITAASDRDGGTPRTPREVYFHAGGSDSSRKRSTDSVSLLTQGARDFVYASAARLDALAEKGDNLGIPVKGFLCVHVGGVIGSRGPEGKFSKGDVRTTGYSPVASEALKSFLLVAQNLGSSSILMDDLLLAAITDKSCNLLQQRRTIYTGAGAGPADSESVVANAAVPVSASPLASPPAVGRARDDFSQPRRGNVCWAIAMVKPFFVLESWAKCLATFKSLVALIRKRNTQQRKKISVLIAFINMCSRGLSAEDFRSRVLDFIRVLATTRQLSGGADDIQRDSDEIFFLAIGRVKEELQSLLDVFKINEVMTIEILSALQTFESVFTLEVVCRRCYCNSVTTSRRDVVDMLFDLRVPFSAAQPVRVPFSAAQLVDGFHNFFDDGTPFSNLLNFSLRRAIEDIHKPRGGDCSCGKPPEEVTVDCFPLSLTPRFEKPLIDDAGATRNPVHPTSSFTLCGRRYVLKTLKLFYGEDNSGHYTNIVLLNGRWVKLNDGDTYDMGGASMDVIKYVIDSFQAEPGVIRSCVYELADEVEPSQNDLSDGSPKLTGGGTPLNELLQAAPPLQVAPAPLPGDTVSHHLQPHDDARLTDPDMLALPSDKEISIFRRLGTFA